MSSISLTRNINIVKYHTDLFFTTFAESFLKKKPFYQVRNNHY